MLDIGTHVLQSRKLCFQQQYLDLSFSVLPYFVKASSNEQHGKQCHDQQQQPNTELRPFHAEQLTTSAKKMPVVKFESEATIWRKRGQEYDGGQLRF
jgi:hypothetical protein